MSKVDEVGVSESLSRELGLVFSNRKFKLEGWGEADNFSYLSSTRLLLLEVETSQKHPNTNVLKLWPYLEDHEDQSVILVQTFFHDSPGLKSNRGELASWLASKMSEILGGRFFYFRLVVNRDYSEKEGLQDLRLFLKKSAGNA